MYEHYNTDVYEPLLKAIGDTGIGYTTKFDEHTPSFTIVLDINSDKENVVSNLKFDTDDIIIYYDDITWYRIQIRLQIVSKISLH